MAKQKKKIPTNSEGQEVRFIDAPVELRAAEGEGNSRAMEGYALKFNTLSRMLGWGFRERILPGALDDIGLEDMDVICCFNHDKSKLLGRSSSGTLKLEVDEVGLRYYVDELPNTTHGDDVLELLTRKDLRHSSFTFSPPEDRWIEDEEYGLIREIIKFRKLGDVSPVTDPAYFDTPVDIAKRSFEQSDLGKSDWQMRSASRKRQLQLMEMK